MSITETQLENVQVDYGIVFANYGVAGERRLGPTRGGGSFKVTAKLRDIEYDGGNGKSKGMQVLEDIIAILSVVVLDTSMETLAIAMPWATYDAAAGTITAKSTNIGGIQDGAYLENITMFAKLMSGQYKKITLYNAMSESDFELAAKPKGEAEIGLELTAHWDAFDDAKDLFKIEDVVGFSGDTIAPTAITVPADAAVAVVVTANLTATFSEDIKVSDMTSDNFILQKTADGTIIAGTLSYTPATKVVTFDPTASLEAATPYTWSITNVRDTSGNKMAPKIINFTTA